MSSTSSDGRTCRCLRLAASTAFVAAAALGLTSHAVKAEEPKSLLGDTPATVAAEAQLDAQKTQVEAVGRRLVQVYYSGMPVSGERQGF